MNTNNSSFVRATPMNKNSMGFQEIFQKQISVEGNIFSRVRHSVRGGGPVPLHHGIEHP